MISFISYDTTLHIHTYTWVQIRRSKGDIERALRKRVLSSDSTPGASCDNASLVERFEYHRLPISPPPPPPLLSTQSLGEGKRRKVGSTPTGGTRKVIVFSCLTSSAKNKKLLVECAAAYDCIDLPTEFVDVAAAATATKSPSSPEAIVVLVCDGVVRQGTDRLVKRSLAYLKCVCLGVLVVDIEWLQESRAAENGLLDPHSYAITGTTSDARYGGPQRSRVCCRLDDGRSRLLEGCSLSIVHPNSIRTDVLDAITAQHYEEQTLYSGTYCNPTYTC